MAARRWKGIDVSVGSRVLVRHVGEVEFHERLITAFRADRYPVMLTPQEDHYVHPDEDIEEVVMCGVRGGIPAAVRASGVYVQRFTGGYSAEELRQVFDEGAGIAAEGVPETRPSRRLTGKGPADRRPLLPLAAGDVPVVEVGESAKESEGGVWTLVTPMGSMSIGTDMSNCRRVAEWKNHGLVLVGGEVGQVQKMELSEVLGYSETRLLELRECLGVPAGTTTPRAVENDDLNSEEARVLKPLWNRQGVRFRGFGDAVGMFDPQDYEDWPLSIPRTAAWVCGEIAKLNFGPNARHEKWKNDNRLVDDDACVVEHEILSEILELSTCYDQLDISNLAGHERLCRRLQFVEEGYRQRLEEKRMATNKDLTATLSEHFSGRPRMAGGAIVSPALLKHAAEKAALDNDIVKQQRKAAETRALLKNKK